MTSVDSEVPQAILRAAEQVSSYFEDRGILVWQLGNIRSKGFEPVPAQPVVDNIKLRALVQNIEVTGPDEDQLVWLVFHGKGTSGKAMINIGHKLRLTAQAAMLFEQDRKAVLGLTLLEDAGAKTS